MIFGNYRPAFSGWGRHKVFISYYHRDDQIYRDEFEERYGFLFISKSVKPGEIDSDLSSDYIKRLIREDYVTDSSVLVVLVGPNTRLRKHVDWEISAALSEKAGGYSGLIGILLPTFPVQSNLSTGGADYRYSDIPDRLADDVRSGYADVYVWPGDAAPDGYVSSALETAFCRRITHASLIQNSRPQMERNRPHPIIAVLSALSGTPILGDTPKTLCGAISVKFSARQNNDSLYGPLETTGT